MPNLSGAKKAHRVSNKKAAENKKVKTRFTRIKKKTLKLIEMGEIKLAQQQLPSAYKSLDKAAKKKVIHPNKSARMKADLTKKVNDAAKNVKTAPKKS